MPAATHPRGTNGMASAVNLYGPLASKLLVDLIGAEGSVAQAMPARLAHANADPRDRADAAHHLCLTHGRHPGVIERAADATQDPLVREWLMTAAQGFAVERAYLVSLTAAAGPPPSTPGQSAAEAAIVARRHALDTLSQSARPGCALGAAVALVLDWPQVRLWLDAAAVRLEIDAAPDTLPAVAATRALVDRIATSPLIERALLFGARQLLAQQRALWDLLEMRAAARG